jgi:hypothetical protein
VQYFHVFVDDSVRQSYVLCAVWVAENDVNQVRRTIRAMCRPGQRRLHFGKEQDSRRRQLLAQHADLPIYAQISLAHGNRVAGRRWCLERLVCDAVTEYPERRVARIVIESRRSVEDDWDRRVIYGELLRLDAELPYEHLHAYEEPMLWAADAIAWAFTAGAEWRNRVADLIKKVFTAPR